jgi:hypothetical protein
MHALPSIPRPFHHKSTATHTVSDTDNWAFFPGKYKYFRKGASSVPDERFGWRDADMSEAGIGCGISAHRVNPLFCSCTKNGLTIGTSRKKRDIFNKYNFHVNRPCSYEDYEKILATCIIVKD